MPFVWFLLTTGLKHDQGKHVFDSSKTTYSKELMSIRKRNHGREVLQRSSTRPGLTGNKLTVTLFKPVLSSKEALALCMHLNYYIVYLQDRPRWSILK